MGSPKPLLRYRGQTFLDTLIELLAGRCSPVIVVLGAKADQIRSGVTAGAVFVFNPDYLTGQTSSMQCGLRALPASFHTAFQDLAAGNTTGAVDAVALGFQDLFITGFNSTTSATAET